MKPLFVIVQYCLPHHLLSRVIGRIAASHNQLIKNRLIRWFIKRYRVDLSEAIISEPEEFLCFNDFFTRELKEGSRPIQGNDNSLVSPADGVISAIGDINEGMLIQAKGKHFSLNTLLGGNTQRADVFQAGNFSTIYLSPRDYHRVHMPLAGTLQEMTYIPGRLFSVNQTTAENIPGLFARNERLVCFFDTEAGPMAVVLVGAMIVAGIETVWSGQVAPSSQTLYSEAYDGHQPPISLPRGAELGRFKLGSTAIVLTGPGMLDWTEEALSEPAVRMGEVIGNLRHA